MSTVTVSFNTTTGERNNWNVVATMP